MNLPPVVFGIETEIGITRDDDLELDVVAASSGLGVYQTNPLPRLL